MEWGTDKYDAFLIKHLVDHELRLMGENAIVRVVDVRKKVIERLDNNWYPSAVLKFINRKVSQ